MDLLYRTACAELTLAQFITMPFAWGRHDCARMTAAHVRRMGHAVSLAMFGGYTSLNGARRALKRAGYDSLEAVLDARFDRIAPASAWVGDIVAMEGKDGLAALAVRLSNGRILCTHNGGFAIAHPKVMLAAWRIPCLITEVPHG